MVIGKSYARNGVGIVPAGKRLHSFALSRIIAAAPGWLHGLGTKGFAKFYGFDEADLLADTNARLRRKSDEARARH